MTKATREIRTSQAERRNVPRRSTRETSQIRAPASASDAAEDDGIRSKSKRTRGKDTRGREFYVTKKDVERFGPTARCPTCADTTKGISGRHTHNDECRDRVGKIMMDEEVQGVESYFERTRVREETDSGGTATSSGSATVVTNAQTPKRKAHDETVETDIQSKKRQTADTVMPRVQVGGSSSSGSAAVSPMSTEQRVVVPPEVWQDRRNSIEDIETDNCK